MTRAYAILFLVLSAAPAGAQAPQDSKPPDPKQPTTMNGCVDTVKRPQDPVTFSETETGFKYRITGKGLKKYAGQRVEVVGTSPIPKRFAVRGGLYPSPNVAAQAGALDPAKAAIAQQPGGPESGTGAAASLPEFRVTRVRVLGSCQ
jgi:hypothetical protein